MGKDANGNEIPTEPGDTPDNGSSSAVASEAAPQGSSQSTDLGGDSSDPDFDSGVFSYLDEPAAPSQTPAAPTNPAVTPPVATGESATPPVTPQGQQPAAPVQPAVPPQQAATPPQATPPAPAAPPAAQTPPAAQPTGAQNPQPPADEADPFAKLDQAISASRDQTIQAVASQAYQLSQQELEAVATEPEKILPVLMAKVHVNAVQGVLRHVSQQMPGMVTALMQAQQANRDREEQFFKQWPQLDKTKHMQDIIRAGQVFRQMNPTATHEDFIKHVGAHVVLQHGLHQRPQAAQPPQQVAQPRPAPVPPPFAPAGVGGAGAPAAPAQKPFWEEFVEVMNE